MPPAANRTKPPPLSLPLVRPAGKTRDLLHLALLELRLHFFRSSSTPRHHSPPSLHIQQQPVPYLSPPPDRERRRRGCGSPNRRFLVTRKRSRATALIESVVASLSSKEERGFLPLADQQRRDTLVPHSSYQLGTNTQVERGEDETTSGLLAVQIFCVKFLFKFSVISCLPLCLWVTTENEIKVITIIFFEQ